MAMEGLAGAVQNEVDHGAPLPGSDGCTSSEVVGDCWVHHVIPPAAFPPSAGILPERNL